VSVYNGKNDCYFVRDRNVLVDAAVMEPLNDLMKAFYDATGINDVNVVSGLRTYEEQQSLYEASLEANGEAYTALFVAQPGCSEHHTGLAVDLSIYHADTGTSETFDGSGPYGWIAETGWRYGFVLRYPEAKKDVTQVGDEPWHFRYVGVPHAWYMTEHELCPEEYIELLRGYTYVGEHLSIECSGHKYEVYFCPGTDVYVPKQGEYDISGNNIDGFIVTVAAD
jgi:D-alanyl-D-alanine carboxypeptidase